MKIIVGNLKVYLDGSEIKDYLNKIKKENNIVIMPSLIHIPYFLNKNIKVGLQNIDIDNITGGVSALQGRNLGVSYVLLGHWERKKYFNETNAQINFKIKDALNNNLNVILCIGETEDEKKNNMTKQVLKKQLNECLDGITKPVIIAYEPVWSISSGNTLSSYELSDIIDYIKLLYPYKVLYGGSVDKNNVHLFEQIPNLDGYLIGKASSNVDEFNTIIEVINKK